MASKKTISRMNTKTMKRGELYRLALKLKNDNPDKVPEFKKNYNTPGANTAYWRKVVDDSYDAIDKKGVSREFREKTFKKISKVQEFIDSKNTDVTYTLDINTNHQMVEVLKNIKPQADDADVRSKITITYVGNDGQEMYDVKVLNRNFMKSIDEYYGEGEIDEEFDRYEDEIKGIYMAKKIEINNWRVPFRYSRKGGSYFPYTLKMETRIFECLQIYSSSYVTRNEVSGEVETPDNGDINCFIYAATVYFGPDNFSEDERCRLSKFVCDGVIDKKDMRRVANTMNYHIILYNYTRAENKNEYEKLEYNKESPKTLEVCLIEGHYFANVKLQITSYAIQNYDSIKSNKRWNEIRGLKSNNSYRYDKNRFIDAKNAVKLLVKNKDKLLQQLDYAEICDVYREKKEDILQKEIEPARDTDFEEAIPKWSVMRNNYMPYSYAFDTECHTKGKNVPYCCACYPIKWTHVKTKKINFKNGKVDGPDYDYKVDSKPFVYYGEDCIERAFKSIRKNDLVLVYKNYAFRNMVYKVKCEKINYKITEDEIKEKFGEVRICGTKEDEEEGEYFILPHFFDIHNLDYDFGTFKDLIKGSNVIIESGNSMVMIQGYVDGKYFVFRNSLSLMTMALNKFGPAFKLDVEKDIMPYNLYDSKTVNAKKIEIKKALAYIKKKDHLQFLKNIKKWNLDDGEYFDHKEYAKIYCLKDTEVLAKGLNVYRKMVLKDFGIDIHFTLTSSSLADTYMYNNKVYEDCYKLKGRALEVVQTSVVGGVCMTANNQNQIFESEIPEMDVLDVNSLYPAAMKNTGKLKGGYLKGKPLTFKMGGYVSYGSVTGLNDLEVYRWRNRTKVNNFEFKFTDKVVRTKTQEMDLKDFKSKIFMTEKVNDDVILIDRFSVDRLEFIVGNPHWFKRYYQKIGTWGDIVKMYHFLSGQKYYEKGKAFIKYYVPRGGCKRRYCEGAMGMQHISRKIRGTLMELYCVDIDMENAHPRIAHYLFHKEGLKCPALDEYIENREKLFNDLIDKNTEMTRSKAKNLMIAIMNGGQNNYFKVDNKPDWLNNFFTEMRKNVSIYMERRPILVNRRKKFLQKNQEKENKDPVFSSFNLLLTKVEDKILRVIFRELNQQFPNNGEVTLTFDGIIAPKYDYDYAKIEKLIKEEIGIHMPVRPKKFEAFDLDLERKQMIDEKVNIYNNRVDFLAAVIRGEEEYDLELCNPNQLEMLRKTSNLKLIYFRDEPDKITSYEDLKGYDGYFIRIKFKDGLTAPIPRRFPCRSNIVKGKRVWTNNPVGIACVNCIDVDTMLEFQGYIPGVHYDILDGYVYNSGRNKKIEEIIQGIHDSRKKAKKQGNPNQIVYKKIANGSYGKTIQKAGEYETSLVSEDELHKFLRLYHNRIHVVTKMVGSENYIVKCKKATYDHAALAHIGSEILSMSKYMMQRVLSLAEDIGIECYYTDTDSIHMLKKDAEKLAVEFIKKYGIGLIGKELGEMHGDFPDKDGYKCLGSKKFIGVGKKMYYDKLVYQKDGTDETIEVDYFKMKGVKNDVVKLTAEEMNITVEELYMKLFNKESVTFDMAAWSHKGIPSFGKTADRTVCSRNQFKRTVRSTNIKWPKKSLKIKRKNEIKNSVCTEVDGLYEKMTLPPVEDKVVIELMEKYEKTEPVKLTLIEYHEAAPVETKKQFEEYPSDYEEPPSDYDIPDEYEEEPEYDEFEDIDMDDMLANGGEIFDDGKVDWGILDKMSAAMEKGLK